MNLVAVELSERHDCVKTCGYAAQAVEKGVVEEKNDCFGLRWGARVCPNLLAFKFCRLGIGPQASPKRFHEQPT